MGCSSSTQTHIQGNNRPPAKTAETNGRKKSASEVSNQISDDTDTIPDQTKLETVTNNEPTSNGIPPEEKHAEDEEALEFEGTETLASAPPEESSLIVDEEPAQAEEATEVTAAQDSLPLEGEIEEAIEASAQEDLETKEDETGPPGDGAEAETDMADVEE